MKRESFASHIIIFGAQIVLTFIVIAIIWRTFYLRQIHVLEHSLDATEAKLNGILERVQNDIQDFEKKVHDLNNKEDKLGERLAELKARQEEIMARHGKSESKPAIK